jgi:hypothetical protein
MFFEIVALARPVGANQNRECGAPDYEPMTTRLLNRRAFEVADELFAPEAIIYESGVTLPEPDEP